MYTKRIQDLINELSSIEELSEHIANMYCFYEDAIGLINDGFLDEFKDTICLKDKYDFYIKIEEVSQKENFIKKYAIGLQDRNTKSNIIRFDDADHHNDNEKVNRLSPPHHIHYGKNEKIAGSSGNFSEILDELKNNIKNLI